MKKRKLDICVISDLQLGNINFRADELLTYLSSIEPTDLILNGNIMGTSHFKTPNLPPSHLKVIKKLLSMASRGANVYYIGNQNDVKEVFSAKDSSNIIFSKQLFLYLNGKKTWFCNGDIFDIPFMNEEWLARLGATGYNLALHLNSVVKRMFKKLNNSRVSPLQSGDFGTEPSEKYVADFEKKVQKWALINAYDTVVCGHIRSPKKQMLESSKGNLLYLNSGDWLNHMTTLEYSFKRWKLYRYENDKLSPFFADEAMKGMGIKELITSIASKKVS